MKAAWRLPPSEIDPATLSERTVEIVLVEFDGPPVVTVWGPGGARRLAVACDEDDTAVRWVEAELSPALWDDLFEGRLTLRDAVLQPHLWIVDLAVRDARHWLEVGIFDFATRLGSLSSTASSVPGPPTPPRRCR